jgi:hypothetical protein
MEHHMKNPHFPAMVLPRLQSPRQDEDAIAEECRNLIRVLSFTIDSLCIDCQGSELKLRYLRSLIASLSTLNSLSGETGKHDLSDDFMEDNTGTRYYSVRDCELERFSAK